MTSRSASCPACWPLICLHGVHDVIATLRNVPDPIGLSQVALAVLLEVFHLAHRCAGTDRPPYLVTPGAAGRPY